MPKILIIGQAPPLQKQQFPYDTTLLYNMLAWVGISKLQAQDLFEFEALSAVFPGLTKDGGHKPPSREQIDAHYPVLTRKMAAARKIILLGRPAIKEIGFKNAAFFQIVKHNFPFPYLLLPHPSKRNWTLIMGNIPKITELLTEFIK